MTFQQTLIQPLLAISLVSGAAAQGTIETIHITNFDEESEYGPPILNDQGQVVLNRRFHDGKVGGFAFSRFDPGSDEITNLIVIGDALPTGGFVKSFSQASLSANGEIVLIVSVRDDSEPEQFRASLVLADGVQLHELLRTGSTLPGTEPLMFLWQYLPFNDHGQTTLWADDIDDGLYGANVLVRASRDEVSVVAQRGGGVPGTAGELNDFTPINITNTGEVHFAAGLTPDPQNLGGIFASRNDQIEAVVLIGDPIETGEPITRMHAVAVNDDGEVVFRGAVHTQNGDRWGIFVAQPNGVIRPLMRIGDVLSEGSVVTQIGWPVINNNNQAAFLVATDSHGWFMRTSLNGKQQDQIYPAAYDACTYAYSGAIPALNDQGQMAFMVHNELYFHDDVLGVVQLVDKPGQIGGKFIECTQFQHGYFYGNELSGLNNRGQVSFVVDLFDNTHALQLFTPCRGDLAFDNGAIDVLDLLWLLSVWGTDGRGAALAEPSDVVNVDDLLEFLGMWTRGECS